MTPAAGGGLGAGRGRGAARPCWRAGGPQGRRGVWSLGGPMLTLLLRGDVRMGWSTSSDADVGGLEHRLALPAEAVCRQSATLLLHLHAGNRLPAFIARTCCALTGPFETEATGEDLGERWLRQSAPQHVN
jgi:hypothetical protein